MVIREVTHEDENEYRGQIPAELLYDLKREYIKGMVGVAEDSGKISTAVFWELKNVEDKNKQTEVEILWFFAQKADEGAELLEKLIITSKYEEIKRIYFEQPELSEAEKEALTGLGFKIGRAESRDIIVTVNELASLKFVKKKTPDYIRSLADISYRRFKAAIMTSVYHGRYGLLEDLPFLPMSRYDIDISCCVVTDEKVNGLLLVRETENGPLRVELLFALHPDANIHLMHMICYAIKKAAAKLSIDRKVILRRHNKATLELIRKLFPDKIGDSVMRGELKL